MNELSLFESETAITLPLKGGCTYDVDKNYIAVCKDTYKNVEVEQELKKMYMWLISNESKQKTKRGIKKFINSWLSRASEKPQKPKVQSFQSLHDNLSF